MANSVTWFDVQQRGRYCPQVAACIAEIAQGTPRELALMRAVLRMSRILEELRDEELQRLQQVRPPENTQGW